MSTLYIVLLIVGVWAVVWGICKLFGNKKKSSRSSSSNIIEDILDTVSDVID